MKKFLLALLTVVFAACLAGAVACSGNGDSDWHTLIFRHVDGVEYVSDVQSGMEVRDGTVVTFSLNINDEAKGEPSVYANEEELTPDGNGVYSITVTSDVLVEVRGISYYAEHSQIIFDNSGVTYTLLDNNEFENGMYVRKGIVIRFMATVSNGYILDNGYEKPVIYVNDQVLEPVDDIYEFTVERKTEIRCEGVVKPISVYFDSGDTPQSSDETSIGDKLVKYFDESGNEFTLDSSIENTYLQGDVIKFKIKLSVYVKHNSYDEETKTGYKVLANNYTLYPDSDGYFSTTLSDNTTIRLEGLELDDPFTSRDDGGTGTAANPFKISKPIDLWQMAGLINGGFYTDGRFFQGYYELVDDIDLEGERLYIIGDNSNEQGYAIFAGNFNGNGHTISNYIINNSIIEQETYQTIAVPYVGLFGYVTAATGANPSIYNLKLDNFTVEASNSNSAYEMYVGSLVGQGVGVNISGCSATNGTINVTGGNIAGATTSPMPAYCGGLIGGQMSAASTDGSINVYSGVTSCHTDVKINGMGGYIYSIGGISGIMAAANERLSAYILNCYTTGNVEGGIRAGGIVGYAAPGTSLINCYSTGDIVAYNYLTDAQTTDPTFFYAYAGGIAGHVGFNSVVYNSFTTSFVFASTSSGDRYAVTDNFVAYKDHDSDLEDMTSFEPVVYKCYGENGFNVTETFIRDTLKWNAADWNIEDGMPVINMSDESKTFKVSFSADSGFGAVEDKEISDQYKPMSSWYSDNATNANEGIPEFKVGQNGYRSYAYFFDADRTLRVPYSFIPTDDVTLYISAADYSEVTGTYYLGDSTTDGARIELDPDGIFTFYKGALTHSSVYTWDGENIVLRSSALGVLGDYKTDNSVVLEFYLSQYLNYGARLDGDKILITGGYISEVEYSSAGLSYTGNSFTLFPEESPLSGLKEIDGFKYGSYYADGEVYTFNGNGSGERVAGGASTAFTFTVKDETQIEIEIEGRKLTATFDGDGYVTKWDNNDIKPFDGFTGVWDADFNLNKSYEFDGKAFNEGDTGNWTSKGYDGFESSGQYKIEDGVLKDTDNKFTAKINEDTGFLEIDYSDGTKLTYYREDSFAGEWYFNHSKSPVAVTLGGIGIDNYGIAVVKTVDGSVIEMSYSVEKVNGNKTLTIYDRDYLYANLVFDAENNKFDGTINGVDARLTTYDKLRGIWLSSNESISTIEFNGEGFYDLESSRTLVEVKGKVWINDGIEGYQYSFDRDKNTATFNYEDVDYTVTFGESGKISISGSGAPFDLAARDVWFGNELLGEDGYVYSFDGRGNLENGGEAKAVKGADERTYNYKLGEDGSITLSGGTSGNGKITVKDKDGHKVWVLAGEDGSEITTLTRNTAFTGNWIIGGEPGKLTIGKIYADDTADGSYEFYGDAKPTDVKFIYHIDGKYLTFEYSGDTRYVNMFGSGSELSVGPSNSTTGANNSACIREGETDKYYDNTFNIYDIETGEDTGDILLLDGLGKSRYSGGMVSVYSEGKRVAAFRYSFNKYDYAVMKVENYDFLLIPCEKDYKDFTTEILFYLHDGEDYYVIARPDALMGYTLKDRFLPNVTYEFDGAGKEVIRRENDDITDKYSYIFVESDQDKSLQTLEFTDEEGEVYKVMLDYSNLNHNNWTVMFCDQLSGIKDKYEQGVTYDVVDGSKIIRKNADGTTKEYEYTIDSSDYENCLHILNLSDDKEELKAGFELKGEEGEWTIVVYDDMYGKTIADKLANGVNYRFDGEGNAERIYGDDTTESFTYELEKTESGYLCVFTKDGEEYDVELNLSSTNSADWTVMVCDLKVSDGNGGTYEFVSADSLKFTSGDIETEYNYKLEIDNGTHIHTITLIPKDGGAEIKATLNLSAYEKEKWSMTINGDDD